jgi:hypothetical protein
MMHVFDLCNNIHLGMVSLFMSIFIVPNFRCKCYDLKPAPFHNLGQNKFSVTSISTCVILILRSLLDESFIPLSENLCEFR